MKKAVCLISVLLAAALLAPLAPEAGAARIRVAQESRPGAGDFDKNILGFIDAYFEKEKAASEVYSYEEVARYSFNGPHPSLRADTSHLFFVTTKEGLCLFIVHDKPNDEDGGVAVMRFRVKGDPDGARILVFDDPYSDWDSFNATSGGKEFFTWHRWFPCCTDGFVLGALEGSWKAYLEFPAKDALAADNTFLGMKFWRAFSADGSHIALKLVKGRRVRLDPMGPLVRLRPHKRPAVIYAVHTAPRSAP
ncbi:hypothetical protein ACFLQ0_02165 [Nitrospinota bacterium]